MKNTYRCHIWMDHISPGVITVFCIYMFHKNSIEIKMKTTHPYHKTTETLSTNDSWWHCPFLILELFNLNFCYISTYHTTKCTLILLNLFNKISKLKRFDLVTYWIQQVFLNWHI
jgi:hypothetical protein